MSSHPLNQDSREAKDARLKARQFLQTGVATLTSSNILFVCGGNNVEDLRPQFRQHVIENHPEYLVLFPEHALEHHIGSDRFVFVDLADLEVTIGGLCFCIVIFPEGPGSFAETGMFATQESLAKKTLVALNTEYQGVDSFLSSGPVRLIDKVSAFNPAMQINYDAPQFKHIVDRIKSRETAKFKKHYPLKLAPWTDLDPWRKCLIVVFALQFLRLALLDDLLFSTRSLLQGATATPRDDLAKICQILLGASVIKELTIQGNDYFALNLEFKEFFKISDDKRTEYAELIATNIKIFESDGQFSSVLEEFSDVN